jgi:alpha-L-rhamnosidase
MRKLIVFLCASVLAGSLLAAAITAEEIREETQKYVLTSSGVQAQPKAVYKTAGAVEGADNLLQGGGGAAELRYDSGGEKPYIIFDMGRASVGGHAVFSVKSHVGLPVVRLAYSNHPLACAERGDFERGSCTYLGVDLPVLPANPCRYELNTIPRDGVFIAPLIQGQQRYVRLQLDTENTAVQIDSFAIVNKDVHDISPTAGRFLCDNDMINQIWYAGSWTLQIASFPAYGAWTNLNGWLIPRKLERSGDVALSKAGAGIRDYTFDFDFEIRKNPDHLSHAGWAFRASDEDNCYVASIDLAGVFALKKRVGGEYFTLKQKVLREAPVDGAQHHIRVELDGDNITTLLDGSQIDSTTDSTFSAGKVGFWHPKEKWFLIDNVKVSAGGEELLRDDFNRGLDKWDYTITRPFIADGAKRDRLVWSGDLDWAAWNVYYAFDDASYMRGSLEMLAFNQTPEGYVHAAPYPENEVAPASGDYGQFQSDEFSAWLIPVAWDYLLYTGDKDTLRRIYPAIRKDLDYLLGFTGDSGLFFQRYETSKHASNLSLGDTGERSYINILILNSLKKTAMIADELGFNDDVKFCRDKAAEMKSAIMANLWNEEDGYFQESATMTGFYHVSNALAMSTGLVTPEQAARIMPRMGRHSHGKFQSLMMRGKFEYDYGSEAMEDLFEHNWTWPVLTKEVPLTVTECMTPLQGGWGDDSHPDTAISGLLTAFILGVRPVELGFAQYSVKPHLSERIREAAGIVPTEKGEIVCSWKLETGRFTLTLTSPAGTSATVALPVEGLEDYKVSVNGRYIKNERIEREGGYVVLRDIQSGEYMFAVEAVEGAWETAPKAVFTAMAKSGSRNWNLKASNSYEDGDWALSKLADGIKTSAQGSKGYTSKAAYSVSHAEWVEVELPEKTAIKNIILYPRTDTKSVSGQTAGFPVDLSVSMKNSQGKYEVVKTLTGIENPLGEAYEISLYTVVGYRRTDSIRIDVTKLGEPASDEAEIYRLQLAELEIVTE